MSTLIKGSILLVLAAFIGECLEFVINMVLSRELGEEGLGLYMAIFPTIMFLAVIASMQLPISISKAVAEKDQVYHRGMLQHTIQFIFYFTIAMLLVALIVLPLLPIFHNYHPLLRWLLILLVPLISFSAIASGYFMGAQHMGKIAFANVLRRVVQLVLLIFIFRLFHVDTEFSILLALCVLIATEFVEFLYLFTRFMLEMRKLKQQPSLPISRKTVLRALFAVSIPATGLRIFHAASFAIKPFLIQAALIRSGMFEEMALIQYGKLAGVAFTIGFFPAFIAHSLLIVLIPIVSEKYANRELPELQSLLKKILFVTLLYAIPVCFVFYLFAEQLTGLFFDAFSAVGYLKLLIPYFFFHYFIIPMQAFLIGLGLVKDAFIHSVYTTTISFIAMFVLGSMPQLQMSGIIMGMNASAVLLSILHFISIRGRLAQPQSWKLSELRLKQAKLSKQN
ncbi:oligosaccharide flippase family protein [Bacillus horti]|uniref:O-antigen/teichoic acid export membrane protein n=1 Tax=Caldalkalibacillus horti TaxID=77523 RepID=A0ABT9W326_9BACI|nr:oligosaccharide flippase family protein [Bacillus horti]MDQ0167641.1 O-antigen/teichoic acid export membrane protein [Bacillus horti]